MVKIGTLYIVATPIGHLDDFSQRAIATLQQVDAIAAEDTRHSRRLLTHYHITTPMFALHAHNENQCVTDVINRLQHGENIALISDAGTPLISDPGYPIVTACKQANIPVSPIPGACAAIAALSVSGLPCTRFSFEGFLPAKTHARQTQLTTLLDETRTLIFYLSPHRVLAELDDFIYIFGSTRHCVFARELTKQFETVLTSTFGTLKQNLLDDPQQQRGEMVLLVAGAPEQKTVANAELERILTVLLNECSLKQAVKLTVEITGINKNTVYSAALGLQKED